MAWKVASVSQVRRDFVHEVLVLHLPVARACRKYRVSRKTGYKWPARHKADPAAALADRSRRPAASPGRTADALERRVLAVRDQYGWGAPKIVAHLRNQAAAAGAA